MKPRAVVLTIVAACTAPQPPAPQPPAASRMTAFDAHGYALAGAEYWPYAGADEPRYPEDVLWGFYPKKGEVPAGEVAPNAGDASAAAVACAERSYGALQAFLASDPPDLRRVVAGGGARGYTNRFYLWTNDYTRASSPYPPGVRPARLWYWKRKTPDPTRPPGYWKWEATLTASGECEVPSPGSTAKALDDALADLAR